MDSTYKALLLIADISGFTQFMMLHKMTTCHAKQIVVKLLEAIVSAAAPPLKLVELEGDAAFFYAACQHDDSELDQHLAAVKTQILNLFRSFYQTLQHLADLQLCICEACAGTQNLRLKIVMHAGEVAVEQIRSFEKLFGLDVILVHRLLKNSVPSKEYVLMTTSVYSRIGDFYQLQPEIRKENCEGIGKIETAVFYPPAELIGLVEIRKEVAQPKFLDKLGWYLRLDWIGLLDILGIRKLPGKFQHLPARVHA